MSFLKKIFGNTDKKPLIPKPDINSLLESGDTGNLIIELDIYLNKISEFGDALEKLNEPQKIFFFNQQLETEINNGGFDQFFNNTSGDFSHEIILSLRKIDANKTAGILQLAINEFPCSLVPKDQAERWAVMKKLGENAEKAWDELDEKFLAYEDNLYELNLQFIKQNIRFL